jgi:hypothetical protein
LPDQKGGESKTEEWMTKPRKRIASMEQEFAEIEVGQKARQVKLLRDRQLLEAMAKVEAGTKEKEEEDA